jgi:hypothetical protein
VDDPNDDLDALIEGYFADHVILSEHSRRLLATREHIPVGRDDGYDGRLFDWFVEMLNYGPPDGAERAWPIILQLIARAPDDRAVAFVGSGAVEDLVNRHGTAFLERIVDRAARDSRFVRAIRHVWFHDDVPQEIKDLIEASRAPDGT